METQVSYTILVIKPDAMKDLLCLSILNDFENAGFRIVLRKVIQFSKEAAEFIYRDHALLDNFVYAVASLLEDDGERNSMIFVLSHHRQDALAEAQVVKGRADRAGVRARYRRYIWFYLKNTNLSDQEQKVLLSKNRVHVPDTNQHAAEIINRMFSWVEIQDLCAREPTAGNFLRLNSCTNLIPAKVGSRLDINLD